MTAEENARRLEGWVRLYGSDLLRLCWSMLGTRDLAEDAVQETFVKAWRGMNRFEDRSEGETKAWLCRIAVNVCRDTARSAWWKHRRLHLAIDELPPALTPVSEDSRELFLLIADLPKHLKEPLLLHALEGLTMEETAAALGISRPTLRKRLKQACELLRVEWTEVADDA